MIIAYISCLYTSHLCGMAIYNSLLNAHRPGKIKQELLYSLCMPGTLSALLFPAWSAYPAISLICIQNFLQHGLLMIYPIMLFSGKNIRPDYRVLPKCLLFLAVISPPIYVFNKVFDTNFLFINYPSPGSPLVLFDKWFGNPGYILGILMLIIVVWAFLYIPIIITNKGKMNNVI